MLEDLDKTFERLIKETGNLSTDIDVSFELPNRDWSARLSRPTLNCFCFDMRENPRLRHVDHQVTRSATHGRITLPPRRIDLSYLVTAWARKIEDEHRLLWRAFTVFKRSPVLQRNRCEGALRQSIVDIPLNTADFSPPNERYNLVELWSVLDNQMRLGFVVTATVEFDTAIVEEAPLVFEATFKVGQSETPTEKTLDVISGEIKHKAVGRGGKIAPPKEVEDGSKKQGK
ncbi:MAG: DUF4255 domain-containing protein [Anaerolineae bacterium]|jgi:hypothetical protein|nr:DUF4255 domain-containing protein [Anaerolineae bacterium]